MAATIVDVAARAGVSTATVSRILSGAVRGRAATRGRVLEAAQALDYRPSGVARSLKLRRTRTLGLLITDIQNPFYPELVRAAEDAATERSYALLLGNGAQDRDREAAYLEVLAARRVDGILIAASSLSERHARWIAQAPVPIVLANCSLGPDGPPAVLCDNEAGGRLAAEHLLGLGHRRLGYLAAEQPNPAAEERLAGFRAGLAGRGGLRVAVSSGDVRGGRQAMATLVTAWPEVTAMFCFNDQMALGALRAAHEAGRQVPADLSLVGFDDIALAADIEPALTTVAQPIAEMGRWAVQRLIDRIDGVSSDEGPTVLRLPVHLQVRGTTAPCRVADPAPPPGAADRRRPGRSST
jgi:DNA-binding LacI/PurR family transcriptional regulator